VEDAQFAKIQLKKKPNIYKAGRHRAIESISMNWVVVFLANSVVRFPSFFFSSSREF